MNCPHCKAPVTADARFCGACGKATAPTESDPSIPLAAVVEMAGKEIAGRYRILTKLGEGGMGAVYRGEQISLRRPVAVKLLRAELSANPVLLRRFSAEAEAVAKLSHPNTVNVYDFGQDSDGSLFIAMELIEGRSLRDVVAKQGPLPPARALHIAAQVAASLADAHAHKIVHRDLKPDNVMLQDRGRQRDVARVLDFGIAKLRDDSRATQQAMTQQGDMLGTPQYMAPEQIKGDPVDGRCDIYALGCMIYEMVTARLPFEAPTIMAMLSKHLIEEPVWPSKRRPDLQIPPAIDQLVLAAMQKDPARRPATMEGYEQRISTALATLPMVPTAQALGMATGASGAVATPPASQPIVTPVAPSVYGAVPAAQTPRPVGQTPAPASTPAPPAPAAAYVPPPIPPTTRADPVARASAVTTRRSRAPLIVAVSLVLAAGGGLAAYFVTVKPAPAGQGSGAAQVPPGSAGSPTPIDAAAIGSDPWGKPPDPWNTNAPNAAPSNADDSADSDPGTLSTDETPMPPGAKLIVPAGWTKLDDPNGISYIDPTHQIHVGMGPLAAGTNDASELAQMWESQTGAKLEGMQKLKSAGAMRDAAAFETTVDGVEVAQIIVAYITPKYRVGVVYQAPLAAFKTTTAQQQIQAFFERDVVLP